MGMGKQDEGLGPEGLEGDGVVDFEKRINSLVKRLVTSQRAEDWAADQRAEVRGLSAGWASIGSLGVHAQGG